MTAPALDKEGYLKDLNDWTPSIAKQLAADESIELTDAHWELIELIRQFHREFELSPAMRPLVKYTRHHLGVEKGTSIYLMKLFPGSPAKRLSKIAGLPKPENCL